MYIKPLPPIERLRELLSYDEVTGELRWKVYRNREARAGDLAGTITPKGYRLVGVDRKNYAAHRIAYALHHGVDPWPMEIDHKNRNTDDNRIVNLNVVTRGENCKNRYRPFNIEARRNNPGGLSKKVVITYPNGEVVTTPSISWAARILGVTNPTIRAIIEGENGKRSKAKLPGIVVCYEM